MKKLKQIFKKPGVYSSVSDVSFARDYWFPKKWHQLDRMRSIAKIFDLDYDGKLIITSTPTGCNNWSNLTNNTSLKMKVPVGPVNKPTMIKSISDFTKIFGKIGK